MALKGKLKVTKIDDLKFSGEAVVTTETVKGIPTTGVEYELVGSGRKVRPAPPSHKSESTGEQLFLGP